MSGIKKGIALLLALALTLACGAFAEDTIACVQGDSFDATFTLTQNPSKAVAATMKLNYDHNALELVPSSFAQNDGAFMLDLNGIAEGTAGTASFRVRPEAPDGEYTITLDVVEAGDINEQYVTDMLFTAVTVRVGQNAVQTGKTRKPNEYYSDGKLSVAYDYNEEGFLGWRTYYNRYGKIEKSWTALEFDGAGNAVRYKVSYPGKNGKYTEETYEAAYDERGNEIFYYGVYKDGSFAYHAEKTYDENNRTATASYFHEDGERYSFKDNYRYDDKGHLLSTTNYNPDGSVKEYYQAVWNDSVRISYTDTTPEGQVTSRYTYDPIYGDELTGQYTSEKYTRDETYTYGQDGFEEETYSHYFDSASEDTHTVYQYDTQGRCVKYTYLDENGNEDGVAYYEYGENGAYTSTYYSSYNSRSVYVYDEFGRHTVTWYYSESGSYDSVTYYEFDEKNREIGSKEYDLSGELQSYSELEYDEKGRETHSVTYYADGAKSYESYRTYNENGESTRVFYSYFRDGTYTVYEYDEEGNTQKRSSFNKDGELEKYYLFEYGEKNRVTREIEYDNYGLLNGYTTYQYNDRGDYTERAEYDSSGRMTSRRVYEYDGQGRETVRTTYNEKGQVTYQVQYRYDDDGTQHQKTDYYSDGVLTRQGEWN